MLRGSLWFLRRNPQRINTVAARFRRRRLPSGSLSGSIEKPLSRRELRVPTFEAQKTFKLRHHRRDAARLVDKNRWQPSGPPHDDFLGCGRGARGSAGRSTGRRRRRRHDGSVHVGVGSDLPNAVHGCRRRDIVPPCSVASRCFAPLRPFGRRRRPGPDLRAAAESPLSSAA